MDNQKFRSLEELYLRVYPALRVKVKEMKLQKLAFVSESELWDFFCNYKWKVEKTITLGEMVDDILNTDSFTILHEMRGNSK